MVERRYGEEEVREIFARASRAGEETSPVPVRPPDQVPEGLTLGELQAAGLEAGLSPDRVARAAAALDAAPEVLPRRKMVGLPFSTGRIVDLPRRVTSREWQFLVSELRETFDEKGEVRAEAGIREWSTEHLHAVLEETETGHRLRLGAHRREEAVAFSVIGFLGLGMALLLCLVLLSDGEALGALVVASLFGLGGVGTWAAGALRLPRWAGESERRMEHIAEWTQDLLSGPPKENAT